MDHHLQQTLVQQDNYKHHFIIDSQEGKKEKIRNETIVPYIRIDSAVSTTTTKNNNNPISIDLEHSESHTYLPGEVINGIVTIDPVVSCSYNSRGRVDIHLACSFRVSPSDDNNNKRKKQSIFKVMMSPIWISEATNQSTFSLTIPSDLPAYNPNDESIHGRIEYKIKAIYEIATTLPLSLYPKTSVPILISAQISTADPIYSIPMQSKKAINITIPRDVTLKNKRLRKGEKGIVSARLNISNSCYLPGQNIPFSLDIQHIAPVKQTQGIQIILERITRIHDEEIGDSIETKVIEKLILPLLCDLDDYSASITSQLLRIPENLSPTSTKEGQDIVMPFYIHYRLKALINMNMHHFLEDIPLRKRDRAYSMMTKIIGSLEQDGPAFFYGTTIELDLPITIGTTHEYFPSPCQSLLTSQQFTPILSNNLMMVTSPDETSFHHTSSSPFPPHPRNMMINRFDSDPTFNRNTNTNYLLLQQQQRSSMFLSTASFFGGDQQQPIERPPSAPPLVDLLQDQTSPPPYLE